MFDPSDDFGRLRNTPKTFSRATKHLYNWLYPLVGWSVGRSEGNDSFDDPHVAPIGLLGFVVKKVIGIDLVENSLCILAVWHISVIPVFY